MRNTRLTRTSCIALLSLVIIMAMEACRSSAKLPLCHRFSDSKPSNTAGIGRDLFDAAKKRHIEITVLSDNVAEFTGPKKDIKWLEDNYPFLMCDFDQSAGTLGRQEYVSCISHAKVWIRLVQSRKPEQLMLDSTIYCQNCLPNRMCN
jgi:hypothetical protein